ncbi:membrane protein [Candidatus Magnetomorum sp. HK-1]|nr:membrane protein [Candidatus Magnetomorum sp. HK-1]
MAQNIKKTDSEDNAFTEDISVDTDELVAHAQENYFEHEKKRSNLSTEPPLIRPFGGSVLLNAVLFFLYAGLAIPVILIFLIQAPSISEHVMVFDIPFEKIVLVYFLSGALLTYIGMFFLKIGMLPVIGIFLVSIFCCFPLIYGLRHDMTIQMAMTGIQLFIEWPVFLKPAHVMFECLIPLGVLLFIFLHIKFFLSNRQQRTYAFLFAAVYLGFVCIAGHIVFAKSGENTLLSYVLSNEGKQYQPVYQTSEGFQKDIDEFQDVKEQTQQNIPHMSLQTDDATYGKATEYGKAADSPMMARVSQQPDQRMVAFSGHQASINNALDKRINEMSIKLDLIISAITQLTTQTLEEKDGSTNTKSNVQMDINQPQLSADAFAQAIKELSQKVELISRSIPVLNNDNQKNELKANPDQKKEDNTSKKDLHVYPNAFTNLEKELKHISETVDQIITYLNMSEARGLTP